MGHLIVGTAGHIDHGKSSLVRSLTGTDPDRLREEKARGITIELGFADLPLGDDRVVSFVDVPGHERFVRHMVAGASGIGAVLLVVAADEGVMPQTREHLEICALLGVRRGVVALNKCDAVDAELLEVAQLEVREALSGSFLAEAPLIPVSARTGEGLEPLKAALSALFGSDPGLPAHGPTRLPVDRSFVMRGFGTVVTGSLASGTLADGATLEVLPGGREARVRGLQVHGEGVPEARAGQRVAVNLQGLETADVPRGSSVVSPGCFRSTARLWAAVRVLESAPDELQGGGPVTLHVATAESPAVLRWRGPLDGGERGAELFLDRPVVCVPGDRFILRRPAPVNTVGGGRVLEAHPPPGRVPDDALPALAKPDRETHTRWRVASAGRAGIALAELALRNAATPREVEREVAGQTALRAAGDRIFDRDRWRELADRTLSALADFHRDEPLRSGVSREALRAAVEPGLPQEAWRELLQELDGDGALRLEGENAALAGHRVELAPQDRALFDALDGAFREGALEPPEPQDPLPDADPARRERILALLVERGRLVRTGGGRLYHREALDALLERLREHATHSRRIDVAAFKDLAGVTRKNAIPLLEHLDERRVTRRVGNEREILL